MNISMLKRFSLILPVVVVCLMAACPVIAVEQTPAQAPKPYSPFDEPKPKVPDEILADKRLDQKIKVFVKDKNFKQLFTELSEKTGLKISAARELWGERAIVYFHNRPVRDVMTEISDLYGFCWLVKGEPGTYEYQMFEDMRRVERRKLVAQERKQAEDALLMDFIHQYFDESKRKDMMAHIEEGDPQAVQVTLMLSERGFDSFIPAFGEEFFRNVLAQQSVSTPIADLSPELRTGLTDWMRKGFEAREEQLNAVGMGGAARPWDPSEPDTASIAFSRQARASGIPRIAYQVKTARGTVASGTWPSVSDAGIRSALGMSAQDEAPAEKPLPEKPSITADRLRRIGSHMTLLPGDVLEAIARESSVDTIADFHFDITDIPSVKNQPISRAVRTLCDSGDYARRFDGSTLRLKSEKWYEKDLMEEPPADLLADWWANIERNGRLDIHDVLRMAALPDRQFEWPGLRFIPGADKAGPPRSSLPLWASLSPEQDRRARSAQGLPISHLPERQRALLEQTARAMMVDRSTDLEHSVIRMESRSAGSSSGPMVFSSGGSEVQLIGPGAGTTNAAEDAGTASIEQFILQLPDARRHQAMIEIRGLSRQEREALVAQRKADAEADVIELVE